MEQQNIAIIGLGRIGSAFLGELLRKQAEGIRMVCAAEVSDTPGKERAAAAGIKIVTMDEIVSMGPEIDVIFDLTGLPEVRTELREKLTAAKNRHTVIASETIVRVVWALISDRALPIIAGRKVGY